MKISIICGSHSPTSQSAKVGRHCRIQIAEAGHDAALVDLAHTRLPLWQDRGQLREAPWLDLGPQLASTDGVVLVTPEWDGMATPALKNFLVFAAEARLLSHRPALIISVSDSDGGTYPVAELRMSSGKNSRLCFIPEHVIIRHVRTVLEQPGDGDGTHDRAVRRRLGYALGLLFDYAAALERVRAGRATDHSEFPYGM